MVFKTHFKIMWQIFREPGGPGPFWARFQQKKKYEVRAKYIIAF